jgi:hypothetical protein
MRRDVGAMGHALFDAIGVPFVRTTELQRQILAAFAFGMAYAAGRTERLTQPEVHAMELASLVDVFGYSQAQAAAFCQELINSAAEPQKHQTMSAVIHRGIDGHAQWQHGNREALVHNVNGVLLELGALPQ